MKIDPSRSDLGYLNFFTSQNSSYVGNQRFHSRLNNSNLFYNQPNLKSVDFTVKPRFLVNRSE